MASNYHYEWTGKRAKIVEKSTCYTVCFTCNKKDSIMITNWLNAGGGFAGNTPQFFMHDKIVKVMRR